MFSQELPGHVCSWLESGADSLDKPCTLALSPELQPAVYSKAFPMNFLGTLVIQLNINTLLETSCIPRSWHLSSKHSPNLWLPNLWDIVSDSISLRSATVLHQEKKPKYIARCIPKHLNAQYNCPGWPPGLPSVSINLPIEGSITLCKYLPFDKEAKQDLNLQGSKHKFSILQASTATYFTVVSMTTRNTACN